MPRLKKHHKTYIIRQLACFERPCDIVTALKEIYGVEVSQSQISYYNPESNQGSRELAPKWRYLHERTRDKFLNEVERKPLAHKGYRLGQLQKILDKAMSNGNYNLVRKVVEQAAKEMGGYYNRGNKHDVDQKENETIDYFTQINQQLLQANREDKEMELKGKNGQ